MYATWGVKHRALRWIRATYRSRFGIESSYRQSHQARIRTSSRKPALRLLFMGVALVLRNVWVWLHAEVMAQPQRGARQLRPQSLRFARLLLWLLMEVARHYRLLRKVLFIGTYTRGLRRLVSFSTTREKGKEGKERKKKKPNTRRTPSPIEGKRRSWRGEKPVESEKRAKRIYARPSLGGAHCIFYTLNGSSPG